MSYKTDKLVELFPDAYGASERETLLYKLLDAVGSQLMDVDASVKVLLKSHWVNYANGAALDGLGAIYGVGRRVLRDGNLESDDAFRQRLKSVVQLFTGGGTRRAVLGAVRSALGLPYDLNQLQLPAQFSGLRRDIENLITLVEFSPTIERTLFDISNVVDGATELVLSINNQSTQEENPRIEWRFTQGGGRLLSLELGDTGQGILSLNELLIIEGSALVLTVNASGLLSAVLNGQEIADRFTNFDGTPRPSLPRVPIGISEWHFRAVSGLYDISAFDQGDSFDLPLFEVEMSWTRYQPLTFEVHLPYFLESAVRALTERRGYTGDLFIFQGLPPEQIQDVINQTKAAGVRGSVQFTLNFYDDHTMRESFRSQGRYRLTENANARDALVVGSVNRAAESHNVNDNLVIGAVFDVSPFDGNHGFFE
jgi:hypothetical protein